MLIAQISDMHLLGGGRPLHGRIDTAGALARAVAHLNALEPRPDLVLATGDLVDDGAPAAYRHLRSLLDGLAMPYHVMPGNHDERAGLRAAFADRMGALGDDGFLHYAIGGHDVHIVMLDTVEAGQTGGRLCAARLAWLAARLDEASGRPTLIAMHHPPFVTGLRGMDAINCAGSEALGALVRRHPQIERIVCGHVHRPICIRWNGTVVTTAPATAHQVALDLRADAPVAWIMEPPACQLHWWQPGGGLVTHVSYVGDYGRPTPY